MGKKLFNYSLVLWTVAAVPQVIANPEGFHLVQGDATASHIDQQTLHIETGKSAVIQWDQFSIGEGELTRFIMPDATSVVLNRVVGGNLSEIFGTLEANGKVYLLNPKGVLFGENAVINTASFFASTLDACDADFLKGEAFLLKGDSKGAIVNLGKISAWDGDVVLIAYCLENRGVINASNGVAGLASGSEFFLQPANNERILIRTGASLADKEGSGIDNSGLVSAMQVELKADGHLYQFAIRDEGFIHAVAKEERGGRIFLVAQEGDAHLSGSYMATNTQGKGGQAHFLGEKVFLTDEAYVDVSGTTGGGTVLVGGDYQGANPNIPNAKAVFVGDQVQIYADALNVGDGGKVVLWGDAVTGFFGSVFARGGHAGGNGGFVETSSPNHLVPNGRVNTLAPIGVAGSYLLDPCTVVIQPNGGVDTNATYSMCVGITPGSYDFTGSASATIDNGLLATNLSMCNVVIDASASGTATDGSIRVLGPVVWSSDKSLTLKATDASSNITINDLIHSQYALAPPGTAMINVQGSQIDISASVFVANGGLQTDSGDIVILPGSGGLSIQGGFNPMSNSFIQTDKGGNINITLSRSLQMNGNSGDTSQAYIQTNTGTSGMANGKITIVADGINLAGGTGITAAQAAIYGAFNSGTADIDITAKNVLVQGGMSPTANASDAEIALRNGGTILINTTQKIEIDGGQTSNQNAYIRTQSTGTNPITIQTNDLQLGGGGTLGTSNSSAYLSTDHGNISITANSGIQVSGGAGTGNIAEIIVKGATDTIDIMTKEIRNFGGNGPGSFSEIRSQGGQISLDGTANDPLTINMQGGEAYAKIVTTSGGAIHVGQKPGLMGASGILLFGTSGTKGAALLITEAGGDFISTVTGPYQFTSGSGSTDCRTGVIVGEISGSGNINMTGGLFTVLAGDGTGMNSSNSEITVGKGGGSITLHSTVNNITVNGGRTSNQHAYIRTLSGTGSNPINIHTNGLFVNGSSMANASNSTAEISTVSGNIDITSSGTISILGSQFINSDVSFAKIKTGTGNITITVPTSQLRLDGGKPKAAVATIEALQGQIQVDCLQLNITGGTNGSLAGIRTNKGDISVNSGFDCDLLALDPSAAAFISTFGSNLTVKAQRNISLSGKSVFSTPDPGNLLAIAGVDFEVINGASIIANGTSNSSLTLVADNNFPTPPGIGPGKFTMDATSFVQAGASTPVRIFSARRTQDAFAPTINGVAYTATTEFVDTNQERWGVYYPSAFFGGPGFTLFFKNTGASVPTATPIVVPEIILTRSAFVNSELFFDLDYYDRFAYNDYFYWSVFDVSFDRKAYGKVHEKRTFTSEQEIEDKGLSIKRRRDFNKVDPTRAFF